jgi:hypothetical protein
MKSPLHCALLICLISCLVSLQALAQSLFDGTWKIDLDESQSSTTQYSYLLQDGIYRCPTCDPPLEVKADGQDHQIAGEPCYDTVSLKMVNARTTEETDKRNGKTVGTTRMTVSPDGNTATVEWTESCNAQGAVVAGKDLMARLTQSPRGAHAISGSWRITKRMNRSENALVVTLKLAGDTFSFADPAGQSYTAKLDGTETPFKGDLSNTLVSLRLIDEHTIEETDKRGGKIVEVTRFTVSDDAKTMTFSMADKASGTTRQFVCHRL